MASFNITFTEDEPFVVDFTSDEGFTADFSHTVRIGEVHPYDGEYEIYPSDVEQTFSVATLTMRQNLIIHAVPNTYGHIGWNGSTLSVY